MNLGAQLCTETKTATFSVWAPRCDSVEVEILASTGTRCIPMARDERAIWSTPVEGMSHGCLYQFVLNGTLRRPDPRSRYQPEGVHGPSMLIDTAAYGWQDADWQGVAKRDLVIYELHLGCFSQAGTYLGASERLPELVELGITAVELMPLAQAPGKWNWGYDGVNLFAPNCNYGSPDDLKAFIDACHAHGLAVLLDVVYNHLGPEGNYLHDFGPYFSDRHHTPWGDAVNFDGADSSPVRDLVLDNVEFWLTEYHLDGLRLDAIHFLFDDGRPTILDAISQQVQQLKSPVSTHPANDQPQQDRQFHLIGEANVFDRDLLLTTADSPAFDAAWCDCLMHALHAQACPDLRLAHREYQGGTEVQEALDWGFLYTSGPTGETYRPQRVQHAFPASQADRDFIPSLVMGLQTHDCIGNHPAGLRVHQVTSVEYQRAAAALVLLYPSIPMIFMGEENASAAPFPFFVDFEDPSLREAVVAGRAAEYPQHDWNDMHLPTDEATFRLANVTKSAGDANMRTWYQNLLRLRRQGIQDGWLNAADMQVNYVKEVELLILSYPTQHATCLVLSRLSFGDSVPYTWKPHVGGKIEVLLDSQAPTSLTPTERDNELSTETSSLNLQPVQSIVLSISSV